MSDQKHWAGLHGTRKPTADGRLRSLSDPDQVVDQAIAAIREVSRELTSRGSCESEDQHLDLLQTIYRVGLPLRPDPDGEIAALTGEPS
jgi:hypothetical protein